MDQRWLQASQHNKPGIAIQLKLFKIGFSIFLILLCLKNVNSQLRSFVNTPPILIVPDRNWRIYESEKVGQIIARIRAEDAENDKLEFGLESNYHSNYADPNDKNIFDSSNRKLPFRIDRSSGIVYLNESLIGRGGENLFLYITVFDGQSTAKNEVFVNILRDTNEFTNIGTTHYEPVRNLSELLPSFDRLPGVHSIRNQRPNWISSNNDHQNPYSSINNINNQKLFFELEQNKSNDTNYVNESQSIEMTTMKNIQQTTNVTKLIIFKTKKDDNDTIHTHKTDDNESSVNFKKSTLISIILITCGIITAIAIFIGIVYRQHLCAISKKLTMKSKEEMSKISQQNELFDDSRNSMMLQNWNRSAVFGNRYIPWERDHQAMTNSTNNGTLREPNTNGIDNGHYDVEKSESETTENQKKHDRWEFPRHRLKFFNILGEGAFGQVWRCEATDICGVDSVTTVAVKTLKENATEVEKKDLLSELEVMKSLDPQLNVVRFMGCCTDKDPVFVILEYVNAGKLQTYLRNSRAERHYGNTFGKSNLLTSGDLTSFMYQVAKGMEYLSSRGIIHRDLAARNILITDDHTCKVADFGFARDVLTSKIYERKTEGKLPIRWMAIESLYDNLFSVKSDIWSFGILMWEIVTLGSTPYPGISAAEVIRKVRDGFRLEKPEHCRRELYNIMYYCWSSDPNERPDFNELVLMLDKLLHTEMDYIELERFPDHNYYNIISLSGEKL